MSTMIPESARFFAVTIVLLLSLDTVRSSALPHGKAESIDRALQAYMSKQGIPGLSAAVALDGSVIWSKGYGMADLENPVAVTPETMFRTASMGKTITATAAMQLVEKGTLDIEQPIQRYCPAFPRKPWTITTHHLLAQQSGIRHYGGPRDLEEQSSTVHYVSVADALAPFKDDPLLFEPGKDYLYSTYGYDVLGCVIEGAAGKPFMEVIRQGVFAPSGMALARDDDPSVVIPHRAAGYRRVDGALLNAPHVDMSNRLPAGGYIMTASELASFAARFLDCKLTTCATRDTMLTHQAMKNGDTVNYGLGWAIGEDPSGKADGTASHGGSSPGASGILYVDVKRRLSIVIMSNLESTQDRGTIVNEVAAIVLGTDLRQ